LTEEDRTRGAGTLDARGPPRYQRAALSGDCND